MKRKSDDLDKWIAILSKLAQSEDGSTADDELGLSFYAIRSSTVGDYHKLTELLTEMEEREVIKVLTDTKEGTNGKAKEIKRYRITIKGMKMLFEVLIPARNVLRGLD